MSQELIGQIIELVIGGAAFFCAILVWAKTRDVSWVLIVFASLLWYVRIVVHFFLNLGIIAPLFPPIQILINVLPIAILGIALITRYRNNDWI